VTTYKIGEHYLIDAELREEQVAGARLTFGTTDTHIVSGQKGGEEGIKPADLIKILKESILRSADIRELIRLQVPGLD